MWKAIEMMKLMIETHGIEQMEDKSVNYNMIKQIQDVLTK